MATFKIPRLVGSEIGTPDRANQAGLPMMSPSMRLGATCPHQVGTGASRKEGR